MADWQEGDTVTNPTTGEELTLTGGKWVAGGTAKPEVETPSTFTDAAKATLPALERTGMAVVTAAPTIGSLVAQGVNAAGDYAFPDWKTSAPGQIMAAAEKHFAPNTYTAAQKKLEDATGPLYSAQTPGGKIWEGAVGAAPMGVVGEGAMIPNVIRALASGGASEAAGQATEGTGLETPARIAAGVGTYGLTGAAQPAKIIANTPRAAAAKTLEGAGVPVSAADISGSRLQATLEAKPPAGQTNAVSDAMQQQGGITRPQGNVSPFGDLVDQRGRDLGAVANHLGAQTSIPPTPALRQGLANSVVGHVGQFGGTSLERPEVTQALKDYDNLTMGGQHITGTQYQALTDQWNSSGIPALRSMADTLDQAMDATHPGAWEGFRQNWADYKGLKAAADQLGGAATMKPLSPDAVVNTMYKKTPMYRTAEAAQAIQGSRPAPYEPNAKILSGAGALIGGAGGAYHGGVPGAGEAGLLGLFGLPAIAAAAPEVMGKVFRSGGGQNFMRNLDPKVVSALLAQQGVRGKGTQEPQGASQ